MARQLSVETNRSISSQATKLNDNDPSPMYFNISKYFNVKADLVKFPKSHSKEQSPFKFTSLTFNFEDDDDDDVTDWHCKEIIDPRINYHNLDFRKRKIKNHNKLQTCIQRPQMTPISVLNVQTGPILRRRSLTQNSFDYYKKRHSIIYADLIIQQCPRTEIVCKSKISIRSTIDKEINYLTIDFRKTQALADADQNIKKSKKIQNKPDNTTASSMIGAYKRLIQRIGWQKIEKKI